MTRLLWYSGAKVMSFPFKVMEPESVIKLPAMAANMVDLPAPLEPMTVAKSPGSRWRDRSRMAAFSLTVPGLKVFLIWPWPLPPHP